VATALSQKLPCLIRGVQSSTLNSSGKSVAFLCGRLGTALARLENAPGPPFDAYESIERTVTVIPPVAASCSRYGMSFMYDDTNITDVQSRAYARLSSIRFGSREFAVFWPNDDAENDK
jgi:hypothetical protein